MANSQVSLIRAEEHGRSGGIDLKRVNRYRKKLFKKQQDDKKREEAFKAMEEKAAEATPSRASLKRPRSPEHSHDEAGPSSRESRQSSSPPTNRAENGRMTRSRTRGASPKEVAASQVIVFETDSEEDDSYNPRATPVQRHKSSPMNGKLQTPMSPKDYREMTGEASSARSLDCALLTYLALRSK